MIHCPHCGGGVTAQPSMAGQAAACPHCRRAFTMPAVIQPIVARQGSARRPARDASGHGLLWTLIAMLAIQLGFSLVWELRFQRFVSVMDRMFGTTESRQDAGR